MNESDFKRNGNTASNLFKEVVEESTVEQVQQGAHGVGTEVVETKAEKKARKAAKREIKRAKKAAKVKKAKGGNKHGFSADVRVASDIITAQVELAAAMVSDGAKLLVIGTSSRLFGYMNPNTGNSVACAEDTASHMKAIIAGVTRDYPFISSTSVQWKVLDLFSDMRTAVHATDRAVFDANDNGKFSYKGDMAGNPIIEYNTCDIEQRPIMNTHARVSDNSELVGQVLLAAAVASAKSMAVSSVVKSSNVARQEMEILSLMGGYIQSEHKRLRYGMVINGTQGSGKSILANLIAGGCGYSTGFSVEKLAGQFGSRWNEACILIIDEATIVNELQANGLKNFMTAQAQELEAKYKDTVAAGINFNIIFTTNNLGDFKTFEAINRRYSVITLETNADTDGHNCSTVRVEVTSEQYAALCKYRAFEHIEGSKGVLAFTPTDKSNEVIDGKHSIVMSQLGDITDSPDSYLGAFKVFAHAISKYHRPELKLLNIGSRLVTSGDMELSSNVAGHYNITAEAGKISNYINKFESGELVSGAIINKHYINLSMILSDGGHKAISDRVIKFFNEKFVHNSQQYSVHYEGNDILLLKGTTTFINSADGAESIKQASTAYMSNSTSVMSELVKLPPVTLEKDDALAIGLQIVAFLTMNPSLDGQCAADVIANANVTSRMLKRPLLKVFKQLGIGVSGDIYYLESLGLN